jgi:hypothetical protein
MSVPLNTLTTRDRCNGSERIMTVLGAVVFGGFLVLGVLWLLVTAPAGEVDDVWGQPHKSGRSNWDDTAAGVSSSRVLTHSLQK